MARKPDPQPDDPAQYQRFRDLAVELDVEKGDEKALERVVKKLGNPPTKPVKKGK